MEALKLKIFDVLTEEISVSEFENWLYNSDSILDQINNNSFVYDMVILNYKKENYLNDITLILRKYLNYNEFMMFLSMGTYSELLNSKSIEESYRILKRFMDYFDHNYDSEIQFQIYNLWCDYDLLSIGVYDKVEFNHIVNYTSQNILNEFNSCKSLEEKIEYFNKETIPKNTYYEDQKHEKINLIKKIFAFFKKI